MEKSKLLLLALGLAAAVPQTVSAETVSPYTLDFNTPIAMVSHDFRVAPNWRHIVEEVDGEYVDYYYDATGGVEGSGCLKCGKQQIRDSHYDYYDVYDLLVTPVVSGEISFAGKLSGSYGYVMVYALKEDGTKGEMLHRFDNSELSSSEWRTVSFTLDTPQRVGIRGSEVYLDDFKAANAEIELEKSLSVLTAVPVPEVVDYTGDGSRGTIYWFQQPPTQAEDGTLEPGKVLVQYTVTIKNDGQVNFNPGDENYTVSIINGSNKTVYGTTPVPQALAVGDTSEPFVVEALVPASEWPSSYRYINLNVREDMMGSSLARANSQFRAYEPKFVLREAGTTSTSSLSSAMPFGMVTEPVTKALEIYNDGVAPLTIKSVTLPQGFTTDLEEGEFVIAKKSGKPLNITLPTTTKGTFSGDLVIVYLDKNGEEVTKTLGLSGTVLGANTWFTTFDNPSDRSIVWPEGVIAESGVQTDYQYNSSTKIYNLWLKSYTSASYKENNNKFITPKLHAEAGDEMTFDVARDGSGSDYYLKVYVSTDRVNWGEPVATYVHADMASTAFENKSITFDQAGDYYVGFAIYGMKLDNIAGLTKVDVLHDIYISGVNQSASVQGGIQFTSSLSIIPLKDEDSTDYTVRFFVNNEPVDTIKSLSLTATANRVSMFNAKWTPEVEATVTYPTYFELKFNDGTTYTSTPKDLTIEYQSEFVFFDRDNYAGPNYKPDNRKTKIDFGKVNEPGLTQSFDFYNWGAAPLKIKSVSLPAGFSAVYPVEEGEPVAAGAIEIPAKTRQPMDIVLSATEAGTFMGDLAVTFVGYEGQDSVFTLPIQAIMLDPSKFYASFDNGTTDGSYPAGSVRQSGVQLSNSGSYAAPAMALYSSSTKGDGLFITPKLRVATVGEVLSFDAKAYDSTWAHATLGVYYAATREALEDPDQRVTLAEYSKDSEEEASKLNLNEFKTYTIAMPEAGDFYIGFLLADRAYVDDIYGLSVVPVAHDLQLAASLIPANAVQNTVAVANLSVRNFGIAPEAPEAYTLTAYVNGVAQTIEGYKEIPVVGAYNAATTAFEIPFRSPKPGTFPVYLEFKADDFVLTTEPQDVVFAEETSSSEVLVGSIRGVDGSVPLNLYYKNSETVALYTATDLGLNGGEKIAKIVLKGFTLKAHQSDLKFYYQWTDETEQARPENNETGYDFTGMTQVIDQEGFEWTPKGSETETVDIFTINFEEPIAYEAGKSLRLYFRSTWNSDIGGSGNFKIEASNLNKNCYQRQNDGTVTGKFTSSWSAKNTDGTTAKYLPVLHISLDVTPTSLSGNVTDTAGNAAEGATVTLVSTDGDNVQYEGTTDANGAYNINVIQSSRTYDVFVSKDGKEDYAEAVEFNESKTNNFTLYEVADLNDATTGVTAIESALVKINLGLKPGFNAIALPVALTAEEVATIFGEDAKVYEFVSVDGEIDALAHFYAKTDGMEAGVPYLLELAEEPVPFKVKGRSVVTTAPSVAHYAVDFTATYAPMAVNEGMFFLTADNYVATTNAASHGLSFLADEPAATTLPAFRAYVKQREGRELQTLRFDILTEYTGVEDVVTDLDENAEIYNLQGIRVKNPARGGVYIVNGKKVLVK